jgi:hypothetical protein
MGNQIGRATHHDQSHLVLIQEGEKVECRIIIYRPRGDEQNIPQKLRAAAIQFIKQISLD